MAQATGRSTVMATLDEAIEPTIVRDVLMRVQGLNRIDAMQRARQASDSGLVVENVEHGEARAVVAALAGEGVACSVVPSEKIPEPPAPVRVRNVDCRPKALAVMDLRNQVLEEVAWPTLLLVSVGVIRQPAASKHVPSEGRYYPAIGLGGGPPVRGHQPATTRRVTPPPQSELWLASQRPHRWWRFIEEGMNYDYLGDRLQPSATINFRTFLADLLRHAPTALVSGSTESFVRKDKPGTHRFKSDADFARYNRGQLLTAIRGLGQLG